MVCGMLTSLVGLFGIPYYSMSYFGMIGTVIGLLFGILITVATSNVTLTVIAIKIILGLKNTPGAIFA